MIVERRYPVTVKPRLLKGLEKPSNLSGCGRFFQFLFRKYNAKSYEKNQCEKIVFRHKNSPSQGLGFNRHRYGQRLYWYYSIR